MKLPDQHSFYLEGTNGKGVLLVHGLTGAPAEMKLVARHFHRKGYSVYAPLLAGHGAGTATLTQTRWQDWLASVIRAAEDFSNHTQEMFAAGICVGGKLAMLAAQNRPDLIRAVAIYSPCFRYDGWNVPFYYPLLSYNIGWLSRVPFLDRLSFGETSTMGIKDERLRRRMQALAKEGIMERFPGKALVEMHRLGKVLKKSLARMSVPTFILHAKEDDLSHPRNARIISNNLRAPHKLEWVGDSYHMLHMDRQYPNVVGRTAAFFAAC